MCKCLLFRRYVYTSSKTANSRPKPGSSNGIRSKLSIAGGRESGALEKPLAVLVSSEYKSTIFLPKGIGYSFRYKAMGPENSSFHTESETSKFKDLKKKQHSYIPFFKWSICSWDSLFVWVAVFLWISCDHTCHNIRCMFLLWGALLPPASSWNQLPSLRKLLKLQPSSSTHSAA